MNDDVAAEFRPDWVDPWIAENIGLGADTIAHIRSYPGEMRPLLLAFPIWCVVRSRVGRRCHFVVGGHYGADDLVIIRPGQAGAASVPASEYDLIGYHGTITPSTLALIVHAVGDA